MAIEEYIKQLFEKAVNPWRWGGQFVKWPDNWKRWDMLDSSTNYQKGTKAQFVILRDGNKNNATDLKDSDFFIETLDLIQWIINNGLSHVLKKNDVIEYQFGKKPTIDDLTDKIARAGFTMQAQKIKDKYYSLISSSKIAQKIPPGPLMPTPLETVKNNKKAGMNLFFILGLIGTALILFKNK